MSNNCDPIRIMAVDDHPILRDGIAALIASQATCAWSPRPLRAAKRSNSFARYRPDITLMDLQMA